MRRVRALRDVARAQLRPQCLVRSMALQRLLERDGIEGGRLVVGVRRRSGEFAAHAWVELQGRPLGEDALQRRQFLRIADLPPP